MLQPPPKALIGWEETGPLYDWLRPDNDRLFREHIAATCHVTRERDISYIYNQLYTFCVEMQAGDRVVIADGWRYYAIGELLNAPDSDYVHDPIRDPDAPHQRAIELLWVNQKGVRAPLFFGPSARLGRPQGVQTSIYLLTDPETLTFIDALLREREGKTVRR